RDAFNPGVRSLSRLGNLLYRHISMFIFNDRDCGGLANVLLRFVGHCGFLDSTGLDMIVNLHERTTCSQPLKPIVHANEKLRKPLLARGASVRFLLTRLVDWLDVPPGALVRPKDPREYARKLRFHQKIKSPRDYGVIVP
ncbi:MAG: hypothetical protein WB764_14330, partial [Xanthobacteraceae bacterium]